MFCGYDNVSWQAPARKRATMRSMFARVVHNDKKLLSSRAHARTGRVSKN